MLLATPRRAIWILDHLAPIQEYAAAQAAADAKLFSPPPRDVQAPARDRNYEFWGDRRSSDRTAAGRSHHLAAQAQADKVALRITDAAGKEVREISGQVSPTATRRHPGRLLDLRVQPLAGPQITATPGGAR